MTTEDQLREEKLNILDFPPQLVAEQLTRMAAELFKTLVPAHCLGSIWSERDNRERESLAPTVHDTVMHDNTVANCILVTCLGDASMTAQDRARVVELWIRVAEECRGLGNFCSLHTILSALQSPAIARLQDTWGQVSRESSRTWKKWVRREKRVSRELLVQEATSVLKTAERAHQGAQERQRQQGVVPSLVTFFRSLELLDATMEDYVEGNVLNCRKWNEVSGCGLLVGRVGVGNQRPPRSGQDPLWPNHQDGTFICTVRYTELGILWHWWVGEGLASKTPSWRRSYFEPSVRAGKS
nr:ral guanine nucleotide dissociation stimulator-like isoform X2 [Equus caballus]